MLQHEKQRILSLTLPEAYHALGKDCVQNKRHLETVPQLFDELNTVLAELRSMRNAGLDQLQPPQGASSVQTPFVIASEHRNTLVAKIGLAIFSSYGDESGPPELINAIRNLLNRLETIDNLENQHVPETIQGQTASNPKLRTSPAVPYNEAFTARPALILISLVFFFPVGLFLIWKKTNWTTGRKVRWTAGLAGAYSVLLVVNGIIQSTQRNEFNAAEELWSQGAYEEAADKYCGVIQLADTIIPDDRKSEIYSRTIDTLASSGQKNKESIAEELIRKAKSRSISLVLKEGCSAE